MSQLFSLFYTRNYLFDVINHVGSLWAWKNLNYQQSWMGIRRRKRRGEKIESEKEMGAEKCYIWEYKNGILCVHKKCVLWCWNWVIESFIVHSNNVYFMALISSISINLIEIASVEKIILKFNSFYWPK